MFGDLSSNPAKGKERQFGCSESCDKSKRICIEQNDGRDRDEKSNRKRDCSKRIEEGWVGNEWRRLSAERWKGDSSHINRMLLSSSSSSIASAPALAPAGQAMTTSLLLDSPNLGNSSLNVLSGISGYNVLAQSQDTSSIWNACQKGSCY